MTEPPRRARAWATSDTVLAAALGALPLVVVVLRIGFFSDFDQTTAVALVAASDTLQVVLATLVPLLPSLLFYAAIYAITRVDRLSLPAQYIFGIGVTFLLLTLFATLDAIVMVANLLGGAVLLLANRLGRRGHAVGTTAFNGALVVLIGTSIVLTLGSSNQAWVPRENIRVVEQGEEAFIDGYVIRVTGEWTTVLTDRERRIEVYPSRSVKGRAVCVEQNPTRTIPQLLRGREVLQTYPLCEQATLSPPPPAADPPG